MKLERTTTSPSNLHRRRLCKASHRYEEGLPDLPEPHEIRDQGTLGHLHFSDKKLDRSKLEPELIRLLRNADYEQSRAVGIIEEAEALDGLEYEEGYERQMVFLNTFGQILFPGTCDYWRWYPSRRLLVLLDLKLGYIPVDDAEANDQIVAYGCMGAAAMDPISFYGGIIQPRLPLEERLKLTKYSREALDAAQVDIERLFAELLDYEGDAVPGRSQCRYCKAKMRCPEFLEYITDLVPTLPGPLKKRNVPDALLPLSDEQMGYVGDAIKFADMISDAWKDEARIRIEKGGMTDWELKEGASQTKITNAVAAFKILLKHYGIDGDSFMDCCKVSLPDLVDVLASKSELPKHKLKDEIVERLQTCILESQNAPSVKRKK